MNCPAKFLEIKCISETVDFVHLSPDLPFLIYFSKLFMLGDVLTTVKGSRDGIGFTNIMNFIKRRHLEL